MFSLSLCFTLSPPVVRMRMVLASSLPPSPFVLHWIEMYPFYFPADGPCMVRVNIYLRSISKISDLDMVSIHSSRSPWPRMQRSLAQCTLSLALTRSTLHHTHMEKVKVFFHPFYSFFGPLLIQVLNYEWLLLTRHTHTQHTAHGQTLLWYLFTIQWVHLIHFTPLPNLTSEFHMSLSQWCWYIWHKFICYLIRLPRSLADLQSAVLCAQHKSSVK